MSEERSVTNVKTGETLTMSEATSKDPAEIQRLRADRKAKIARILERGQVVDRLTVENLPQHLHGEWVPNDPQDILRMKMLGFDIDTEYSTKRALHNEGDGKSIIGDCVFMVCSREDREIMQEIRREQFEKRNGKPGTTVKRQAEESDFQKQNQSLGIGPTVEESVTRSVRKDEIESALKTVNTGVVAPSGSIIK